MKDKIIQGDNENMKVFKTKINKISNHTLPKWEWFSKWTQTFRLTFWRHFGDKIHNKENGCFQVLEGGGSELGMDIVSDRGRWESFEDGRWWWLHNMWDTSCHSLEQYIKNVYGDNFLVICILTTIKIQENIIDQRNASG